jgi:hypothetical protein
MRQGFALSTAALALFLIHGAALTADDQQFDIAKVPGRLSGAAWVAPNTNTGDMLVVWLDEGFTLPLADKVMAALIQRDKNGGYKMGKARLLYKGGDLETPCVAYSPESDGYFVVWVEKNLQTFDHDIKGRSLKSNGVPNGGVVNLKTGNDYDDSNPVIVALPSAVGSPPGLRSFLLIWHGRERDWLNNPLVESGLFTTNLDAAGNQLGTAMLVLPAASWILEYGDLSYIMPEDVVQLPVDGALVGALEFALDNGYEVHGRAVFVSLDGGGGRAFLHTEGSDIDGGVRVISMSEKLRIGSYIDSDKCLNRRLMSNLKPKGKAYKVVNKDTYPSDLVKLASDKGAYQVLIVDGALWGRYIKTTGKALGPEQMVLNRQDLQAVRAEVVPGTNRVFAVLQYGGFYESNIMGYVFTAK